MPFGVWGGGEARTYRRWQFVSTTKLSVVTRVDRCHLTRDSAFGGIFGGVHEETPRDRMVRRGFFVLPAVLAVSRSGYQREPTRPCRTLWKASMMSVKKVAMVSIMVIYLSEVVCEVRSQC